MCRAALATLSLVLLTASSASAQSASRSRLNLPNPFSVRNPPPVETIVPEKAPAVLLVKTTEEAWKDLHRFELFPRHVSVQNVVAGVLGFEYDKDLRPWIGDRVAIALMPTAGGSVTDVTPQPIVILPSKNDRRLWQFLDKAERQYQATSTERWYKRATIVEWQPLAQSHSQAGNAQTAQPRMAAPTLNPLVSYGASPQAPLTSTTWQYSLLSSASPRVASSSVAPAPAVESLPPIKPGTAFAVFDDYVVMAGSSALLETYIDALPEEGSLMENPQFQRTMQQEPYNRSLIVGHGNLGQLMLMVNAANQRLVASLPSESQQLAIPQLLPETLAYFQTTTDSVDAYLWTNRDGIQARYTVYGETPIAGLPAVPKTKSANQLLDRLPSASYLSINSANLTALWRLVLAGMEMQPSLAKNLGEMRRVGFSEMGLDDHDMFSWMDGEFALCLFPTRRGFLGSPIGVAFMVQTSDRAAADIALKKLDEYARGQQIYSIKPYRFQGKPATSWNAIYAAEESLLAHSWVDESTLLVTNGTGPMAELLPQPNINLTSAGHFQTAIAPFPENNAGYSYLNVKAASNLLFNTILPQTVPPEALATPEMLMMRKTLASIRSISATASHHADRSQVDLFLALTPALPPRRR